MGSAVGGAVGGPLGASIGQVAGGYFGASIGDSTVSSTMQDNDDGITGASGSGQGEGQYGYNIYPTIVRNILDRGRHFKGSLKNQYTYTFDFTDNQNAYIIPYKEMRFWWSRIPDNAQKFTVNMPASWGVTFHSATIDFDVLGIQRKRIITGGSSSLETIDFEPSQNFVFAMSDRRSQDYTITGAETAPYFIRYSDSTFDDAIDEWSRQEIAQHNSKTIHFRFPHLQKHKAYKINTNYTTPGLLIPGTTGLFTNMQANTELTTTTTDEYRNTILQPQVNHPMMVITSQNIPDISGNMKFMYTVRITTEMHYTLHLKPDYPNGTMDIENRQTIPLPTAVERTATNDYRIGHEAIHFI